MVFLIIRLCSRVKSNGYSKSRSYSSIPVINLELFLKLFLTVSIGKERKKQGKSVTAAYPKSEY